MTTTYWAGLGTMYLIFLTYKDYKNHMTVDDRMNYFMMGASIMLLSLFKREIWYVLCLLALTIGLNLFLKIRRVLGSADISTLTWIFYGLGIINAFYLFWFFVFFTTATLLFHGFKWILAKYLKQDYKTPLPFYIVILISFILECAIFGLY